MTVQIKINDQTIHAEQGSMLIEAADAAGLYIPRFCYHKKLSIVANCRMCLVEVEGSKKPLPACATPVTAGMTVHTKSTMAVEAQKAVMEFLLINHPLDCPICDQGGECELQDLAMGYGRDTSRFTDGKRSVADQNLGALIATDMTRCIHCTRCVRFGQEIAGLRELGATGRGGHMEIGRYIEEDLRSELSGNVIDLCPVGALTSKPYRFTWRSWELTQKPGLSPHDCIGSHLYWHIYSDPHQQGEQVVRVVPKEAESVNQTWISDRDRFSYQALSHLDRILQPRVRKRGRWEIVSWPEALATAADRLHQVIAAHGSDALAGVTHPSNTTEAHYLLQKILRALGASRIDYRIHHQSVSDAAASMLLPYTDLPLAAWSELDVAFLIGSDMRREQPMGCHRLRQGVLHRNTQIFSLHTVACDLHAAEADRVLLAPDHWVEYLAGVLKALGNLPGVHLSREITRLLQKVSVSERHIHWAKQLMEGSQAALFVGVDALQHPQADLLSVLITALAYYADARIVSLTMGANAAGAFLSGAVPAPEAVQSLWEKPAQAYLLQGVEPEYDTAFPAIAEAALRQAACVIALSAYSSPLLESCAQVWLPIVPLSEDEGSLVQCTGKIQHFETACAPRGEARPAWKVLRVLGNALALEGFEYPDVASVYQDWHSALPSVLQHPDNSDQLVVPPMDPAVIDARCAGIAPEQCLATKEPLDAGQATLWGIWAPQAIDAVVRRAEAFGAAQEHAVGTVRLHPDHAARLAVSEGGKVMLTQEHREHCFTVVCDPSVVDGVVLLWLGSAETAGLHRISDIVHIRGVGDVV